MRTKNWNISEERRSALFLSAMLIGSVFVGVLLPVGTAAGQVSSTSEEFAADAPSDIGTDRFEPNDGFVTAPTLSITSDHHHEPDRFEPNDEWDNATRLESGRFSDLKISSDDYDLFTFEGLNSGDLASIEASFDKPGEYGLRMYYPDSETGTLQNITGTSESDSVSLEKRLDRVQYKRNDLTDGAIYVAVWGDSTSQYELGLSAVEPDRFEPNEKPTNPARLEPGSYTGLTLHNESDSDWYEVPVDRGDNITVTTRGQSNLATQLFVPETTGNADTLRTTSGTVWATVAETDFRNESYRDGTAFFYVVGSPGEYSLNISIDEPPEPDPYEPNEEVATAATLRPGNRTLTYSSKTDTDWYKIPVDIGDNLTVSMGGTSFGAAVYYPTADGIASEFPSAHLSPTVTVTALDYANESLEDGYAYISPWHGNETGTYWLNVTVSDSGLEPDRFEPNDDIENAARLDSGVHRELTLASNASSDWYKVPVEQGQTITASVKSDGKSPKAFLYYRNTSGVQVQSGLAGKRLTGTATRTTWEDDTFTDGFAYVQILGDRERYALNISVGSGTNRAPTTVDARASAESGTAVGQYVFTGTSEPVNFALEVRDPDGNLDGAIWAKNASTRRSVPLDREHDTARWSWTFDKPGAYSVTAQAFDSDDVKTDMKTWTVVVGAPPPDVSAEVVRINGKEPGPNGTLLESQAVGRGSDPVRNVTLRITREDDKSLPTESLRVSLEGSSHLSPLERVGDDLYRAEFSTKELNGSNVVHTQRLSFTVATVRESELRVDPIPMNLTTATTLVTSKTDPLNAPVPGWVFDMDPDEGYHEVYVDGQRYLAVKMIRDIPNQYVEGEEAWLVFDADRRLVEDSEVRRKAALTAEVTEHVGDIDADDVRTFREQIPNLADRFIRRGDQLEFTGTVRDSIAELSGTITVAAATGGSSILAKESAKSASKALAKRFGRKLFTDYISSEVAPDNPIAATEQGLELMSEAGLRQSAREAQEVGRILDRRQGADWNYSDADRYWESYPNATTDLVFYMRVRAGTVPSGEPAAQFESIAESYATGMTEVPVGRIQALLSGGGFGYLSEAHENRTKSRALRRIDARSFRRYSASAQEIALDRYGDRVLLGPRPSDVGDGASQNQEPSSDDEGATEVSTTAPDNGQSAFSIGSDQTATTTSTSTPIPTTPDGASDEADLKKNETNPNDPEQSTGDPKVTSGSGPGFGFMVAILALLTATVLRVTSA